MPGGKRIHKPSPRTIARKAPGGNTLSRPRAPAFHLPGSANETRSKAENGGQPDTPFEQLLRTIQGIATDCAVPSRRATSPHSRVTDAI